MVHIFRGLAGFACLLLVVNCVWAWLAADDLIVTTDQLHALQSLRAEVNSSVAHAIEPGSRRAARLAREDEETRLVQRLDRSLRRSSIQFLFMLATSLVAMLVCSITITYFIGTSRWCKEVVEAYSLDPQLAVESTVCKRQAFPWALAGIAAVLVLAALAGAANAGVRLTDAAAWSTWYTSAATLGPVLIAICFWKQSQYLSKNYDVIRTILDKVQPDSRRINDV